MAILRSLLYSFIYQSLSLSCLQRKDCFLKHSSVSHSIDASPTRLLFAKRPRGVFKSLQTVGVQTPSEGLLFLLQICKDLARIIMANHKQIKKDYPRWESNYDILITSHNPNHWTIPFLTPIVCEYH